MQRWSGVIFLTLLAEWQVPWNFFRVKSQTFLTHFKSMHCQLQLLLVKLWCEHQFIDWMLKSAATVESQSTNVTRVEFHKNQNRQVVLQNNMTESSHRMIFTKHYQNQNQRNVVWLESYYKVPLQTSFFILRVSSGADNIHKVFSVVDVRGPQVFQAGRRAEDESKIYDWPTAPHRHRCIWVYLGCPSGTGMYQSGRRNFLVYSVLPTDYGEALSQTGGKRQGFLETGPVGWHFPRRLSMTPGYWSRISPAPQHGGGSGVVNAGAVCQETVHYGQGYEGGGQCSAVPGAPAWKWNVPYAAGWMPVSTGKSSLRVAFRHPEMMCNVSFNATSSFLVWVRWGGVFCGTVDQAQSWSSQNIVQTSEWASRRSA